MFAVGAKEELNGTRTSFLVLRRRLQVKYKPAWVSVGEQKNAYSGVFLKPRLSSQRSGDCFCGNLTSR